MALLDLVYEEADIQICFATLQFLLLYNFFSSFPKGTVYLVYMYISIPLGSVLEINQDLPP